MISAVSLETPRIGGGHLKPISCLSRIVLGAMITQLFARRNKLTRTWSIQLGENE